MSEQLREMVENAIREEEILMLERERLEKQIREIDQKRISLWQAKEVRDFSDLYRRAQRVFEDFEDITYLLNRNVEVVPVVYEYMSNEYKMMLESETKAIYRRNLSKIKEFIDQGYPAYVYKPVVGKYNVTIGVSKIN